MPWMKARSAGVGGDCTREGGCRHLQQDALTAVNDSDWYLDIGSGSNSVDDGPDVGYAGLHAWPGGGLQDDDSEAPACQRLLMLYVLVRRNQYFVAVLFGGIQ